MLSGTKYGSFTADSERRLDSALGQGEVVLDVQYAHDLVGAIPAHGVERVARGEDLALPVGGTALGPEDAHLGAVGGEVLGAQVVELEEVLDELVFLGADGALLAAGGGHHAYLLLE